MEEHLKERLVGAVVLTVLAVLVIPLVLTGSPSLEPIGNDAPIGELAGVDAGLQPFNSKIVPLGTSTPLGPDTRAVNTAPGPTTTPVLHKSVAAAAKAGSVPQQPNNKPTNSTSAKTSDPARKATAAKGWLVQLGSFSNARNALSLRDRLRKKTYSAFTQATTTATGEITRVFVGPTANRQQAVTLATRLFTDTRLKGMVIRQP